MKYLLYVGEVAMSGTGGDGEGDERAYPEKEEPRRGRRPLHSTSASADRYYCAVFWADL
jgi:hypothetical protein